MDFVMQRPTRFLVNFSRAAAILGFCGMLMAGCGKKSGDQAIAPNGQVVVHVGNEVVTTQELENELRLSNIPPDKQKDPQVIKRVLGELVTRKYLFQQATDAKLDRDPTLLLDILNSLDHVFANAF